jgi:ribosomal protein S18 acetylase RimI-like enzyme
VRLRRGTADDLDLLQELWTSVHQRHREAMPQLAPYVSDHESWAERRALYAALLAKPGTVLVLAGEDDRPVGSALGHVMSAAESWTADTWATGDRIGEVESLGVLPEYRGRGIGSALLEELEGALRAQGVEDLVVGALPGNVAAVALYERRGYRPTRLYLSRLRGRGIT